MIEPGDVVLAVERILPRDFEDDDPNLLGPDDTDLGVPVRMVARFDGDDAHAAAQWVRGEEDGALLLLDELDGEAFDKAAAFIEKKYGR